MNKKIFMLKKILRDVRTPRSRYKIPDDLESPELKEYYFVFDENRVSQGKDQPLISKFDENGIPLNKTYIDVLDKDYVYFPISIGQSGLSVFHTYLSSSKQEDKERFLKYADWFCLNAEISEKLGARWLTDVKLPQYQNPGPWQSAFSQSRGISILLRGYQLTGKKEYLEIAEKALIPFLKPVSEGGVTSFTQWGPFYEEYTAQVPTLVLNGMIFSLWGIGDFIRSFPENEIAKKLYREGVQTLIKILPQYDLKYWSRYNLCKGDWYPEIDPATKNYQRLHIAQLKVMYNLTGEGIFKHYIQIFSQQINLINQVRMYVVKYNALKKIGRV